MTWQLLLVIFGFLGVIVALAYKLVDNSQTVSQAALDREWSFQGRAEAHDKILADHLHNLSLALISRNAADVVQLKRAEHHTPLRVSRDEALLDEIRRDAERQSGVPYDRIPDTPEGL